MDEQNLTPENPTRKTSLVKVILVLAVVCIAIAAVIFFAGKNLAKFMPSAAPTPTPIPTNSVEPSPAAEPSPQEPQGVTLARAYLVASTDTKKASLDALLALPGAQPEAVQVFAEALSSTETVKSDVILALGKISTTTPQAVSVLAQQLEDPTVKVQVIKTLGGIGATAAETVPALKKIAANKKEKVQVRKAASEAIKKISPPVAKKRGKKGPAKRRKK